MRLLSLSPPATHEDLFLRNYPSLVRWALQLSDGDRGHAEDLVHDAFIQFTLVRPDLAGIHDLEGYLHGMVRRMHVSYVRRVGRLDRRTASLLEYDSVEFGLRSVDVLASVEARLELETICRYACLRKESSKAGSILILRFFHGYFPSEIALVARIAARVADEWLRIARREARLYSVDPQRLRFLATTPPIQLAPLSPEAPPSPEALVGFLRALIFASRQGACLTPTRLRELYAGAAPALPCATLAHLVSCKACLARVNEHLDIEHLDVRYPNDMLGPDGGSRAGRGRQAGLSPGDSRRRERRHRTTYEHRAEELQVAVNGFLLSTVSVGQTITRQTLAINLAEPIGFVEVFADRHTRLLFVAIDAPPDGPIEHDARVNLSGGRSLDVHLSFAGPWPEVRLVYGDLAFASHAVRDPASIDGLVPLTTSEAASGAPDHTRRSSPLAELVARLAPRRKSNRWTAAGFRPAWAMLLLFLLIGSALLRHDTVFAAVRAAVRAAQHVIGTITQDLVRRPPLPARAIAVPAVLAPAVAAHPPVALPRLHDSRSPVPHPEPVDLTALEIQVLERLDRAGALLGEQITVARAGEGGLLLTAIVDDASRKAELQSILAPLARSRALRLDLNTVAEAVERGTDRSRDAAIVRRYEFDATRLPLEEVLARYVVERHVAASPGVTPDPVVVRAEVLGLAYAVLGRSRQALLHALALARLAEVSDLARLRSARSAELDAWSSMVRSHADGVRRETHALRGALDPVLFPVEGARHEPAAPAADANTARNMEIPAFIHALVARVTTQDAAIRAAFTASTSVSPGITVTTSAFRELLLEIERDAWVLGRQ